MNPISIIQSQDPRRLPLEGKILVAHQPECMPWLGNISKATMGDVYFILDTVQFVKEHWQNRNKIRIQGKKGWQWLCIPLKDVSKHIIQTDKVEIAGDFWKKKHLKAFQLSYQKAPFFDEVFSELSEIYSKEYIFLIDFLVEIILFAFRKFSITVPVYRTSELIKQGYTIDGVKSELVIKMCKVVNANVFVFGRDGRTYIDKQSFYNSNVNFVFQDYAHPVYNQIHGDFIPQMSFLDLFFNHGSKSIEILGKSNYLKE
jgi:hypothetical protein